MNDGGPEPYLTLVDATARKHGSEQASDCHAGLLRMQRPSVGDAGRMFGMLGGISSSVPAAAFASSAGHRSAIDWSSSSPIASRIGVITGRGTSWMSRRAHALARSGYPSVSPTLGLSPLQDGDARAMTSRMWSSRALGVLTLALGLLMALLKPRVGVLGIACGFTAQSSGVRGLSDRGDAPGRAVRQVSRGRGSPTPLGASNASEGGSG